MSKPTHAGTVVFRKSDSQTFYLVIASSGGAHWVLPKGHIALGESPKEAALRELKEETGIVGEILVRLSIQRFEKPGEGVVVQYFLVRQLSCIEVHEKRSLRWADEQTALQLLTFEDAREVLRNAAEVVRKL